MSKEGNAVAAQLLQARVSVPVCPMCGGKITTGVEAARYRPFCSRRCADEDLQKWFGEGYRVPDASVEEGVGETEFADNQGLRPGD